MKRPSQSLTTPPPVVTPSIAEPFTVNLNQPGDGLSHLHHRPGLCRILARLIPIVANEIYLDRGRVACRNMDQIKQLNSPEDRQANITSFHGAFLKSGSTACHPYLPHNIRSYACPTHSILRRTNDSVCGWEQHRHLETKVIPRV